MPIPELLVSPYHAIFQRIDEFGNVCLGELDDFAEAIYQRLRIIVFSSFSSETPGEEVKSLTEDSSDQDLWDRSLLTTALRCRGETRSILDMITACSTVKKALSDQLNLYLLSPISRNSFAVCASDNVMLTAVLASTAATALKRFQNDRKISTNNFFNGHVFAGIAFHTTRLTLFEEEPTDMHAVMRSILAQLTTNPEILQYLTLEVDTDRLRSFFIKFFTGRSALDSKLRFKSIIRRPTNDAEDDLAIPDCDTTTLAMRESEGQDGCGTTPTTTATSFCNNTLMKMPFHQEHIFAVVLDGIDDIDAPVRPCEALSSAMEGGNVFKPSENSGERRKKPQSSSVSGIGQEKISPEDLLPRCLARNVRILLSCGVASGNENGEAFAKKLTDWDRDSMEVLNIGLNSAHDAERLLSPSVLAELGISLTDDEVDVARYKHDIQQDAEYLTYLIDALCINVEDAGGLSSAQLLNLLPDSIEEMTKYFYDRLVDTFGSSIIYRVFGILGVARWGIPELHLRELTKLPPQRFRQMLRYMRVAIELPRTFQLKSHETDLDLPNRFVRLTSPAFKSYLSKLERERSEAHALHERPNFYEKFTPPLPVRKWTTGFGMIISRAIIFPLCRKA
ncbi:unnamed protein product [Phytomonas sp. Hart1]|nr:unnamed protein product [Phytomonas sp. Hart1]|eukprot:CCW69443.1 unnamed protein product [Phytomonas sp. isolate Hart1]